MRKLFVHIGQPKTGSTAIQDSLSTARRVLRRNGLLYPGHGLDHMILVTRFHHKGTRHFTLERRGISPAKAKQEFARLERQIDRFHAASTGNVLLSTEYLHSMTAHDIRALDEWTGKLGFELHIICYVRHPFSQAASAVQQNIKQGLRSLADELAKPTWHSPRRSLGPPLKILGKGRVHIRSFEACRETGAEHDILDATGYTGSRKRIPRSAVNTSLSDKALYALDAYTSRILTAGGSLTDPVVAAERERLAKLKGGKFRLPKESLAHIRDDVESDLIWLKKNFGLSIPSPISLP